MHLYRPNSAFASPVGRASAVCYHRALASNNGSSAPWEFRVSRLRVNGFNAAGFRVREEWGGTQNLEPRTVHSYPASPWSLKPIRDLDREQSGDLQ